MQEAPKLRIVFHDQNRNRINFVGIHRHILRYLVYFIVGFCRSSVIQNEFSVFMSFIYFLSHWQGDNKFTTHFGLALYFNTTTMQLY